MTIQSAKVVEHRLTTTGVTIVVIVVLLTNYLLDPLVATGVAAIALAFWVATNSFLVPRFALRLIAIPVGLTILGIVMGLDHPAYDIAKDVWYFLMPAFALVFGAVTARIAPSPRPLLMGFLVAGTLLSVIFLGAFAGDFDVISDANVDAIRSETGAGYFPTVFALLILLTFRNGLTTTLVLLPRPAATMAWAVNGAALVLSFSRTMWVVFLIGLIVQSRIFNPRRALFWVLAVSVGLTLIVYPPGLPDSRENELVFSILEKVTRSLTEIIPRSQDSESDVNIHWRGYESLMGLQTYLSGTLLQLVFGHGFGALVDLGLSIKLGEAEFRFIPILHNGFIYLLVKVGALGLLGHLAWLYDIFKVSRSGRSSGSKSATEASRLVLVLVLVTLFTTLVISGVFNKHNVLPLMTLVGAALMFCSARSDGGVRTSFARPAKIRPAMRGGL